MKESSEAQEIGSRGRERSTEFFHFKAIAEIEPAAIALVKQLKDSIEKGEYSTLISDDVGGRIPTLLLRKIMRTIRPDLPLKIYFISAGKSIPDDHDRKYAELLEYIREKAHEVKNALVVTQYIHNGQATSRFLQVLEEAGVSVGGLASLSTGTNTHGLRSPTDEFGGNVPDHIKLYIDGGYHHHTLNENHEPFSGVRKSNDYLPYPIRAVEGIELYGRIMTDQDWNALEEEYDYKSKDGAEQFKIWETIAAEADRRSNMPMTDEERIAIQKKINDTRADIDLLAKRVCRSVWQPEIVTI